MNVPIAYDPNVNPLTPKMSVSRILWRYISHHKAAYGSLLVVVIIASALSQIDFFVIKKIIDTASTGGGDMHARVQAAMWFVVILFGMDITKNLLFRISGFIGSATWPKSRAEIRSDLFSYLSRHSHQYFADRFAGALGTKISSSSGALDNMLSTIFWEYITGIVVVGTASVMLWLSSHTLGYIFFGLVCVYALFSLSLLGPKQQKLNRAYSDARSNSAGKTVDVITNMWNVQSSGRGYEETSFLLGVFQGEGAAQTKSWRHHETIHLFQNLGLTAVLSAISVSALWLYGKGSLTTGDLVLVFLSGVSILKFVRDLGRTSVNFYEKANDIRDAFEEIVVPYQLESKPVAKPLLVPKGEISFREVNFSYLTGKPVFEGLNLTIRGGERVGMVGRSGAGKTTLAHLLNRFYDIQSGSITIDGQDIRDVVLDSLRRSIAVVPQDPVLFHRSLTANIGYGRPEASEEEIQNAAKLAHAHEFISHLHE